MRQFADQQRKSGQTNFDIVADNLLRGATIRIRNAEKFDPQLGELTRASSDISSDGAAAMSTSRRPERPASPHISTSPTCSWSSAPARSIGESTTSYTNMSELPLAEAHWEPERFKPTSPPRDFELCRGDVLYLPRGVMHEAFCTDRESMHLTISLASLTFADLLRKAIASAAATDIELRRRVPWFAADDDGEAERLAQQAKDRLVRLATDSDLPGLLRQEHPAPLQAPDVLTETRPHRRMRAQV